jgi:hypothetical protein
MVGDIQTRKHKAAAAQYTYKMYYRVDAKMQMEVGNWFLFKVNSTEREKKKGVENLRC